MQTLRMQGLRYVFGSKILLMGITTHTDFTTNYKPVLRMQSLQPALLTLAIVSGITTQAIYAIFIKTALKLIGDNPALLCYNKFHDLFFLGR